MSDRKIPAAMTALSVLMLIAAAPAVLHTSNTVARAPAGAEGLMTCAATKGALCDVTAPVKIIDLGSMQVTARRSPAAHVARLAAREGNT
jgi:hypothetical protein